MSILRGLHLFATAIAETMTSVAETMADNMSSNLESMNNNDKKEIGEETYEYFMNLGYREQEDYFKSNKYLSMYLDREYYPNSKEYTARGAARIARMYNREFTNRYNNY